MKKLPVYIKGSSEGELIVNPQGLMTEFYASIPDKWGMVRLSLFGEGKSTYLGVMQPDGRGNAVLRRRFSKDGMRAFPQNIEYAADAQLEIECGEDTLWYPSGRGTLTAFTEEGSLVAIPINSRGKGRVPMRIIGGRAYFVFPGKRNSSK